MPKIAVFYHSLFYLKDPPELAPTAALVVAEQMSILKCSGLERRADKIFCGVNGGRESMMLATALLPAKSQIVYHGMQCHNECRTIRMIEQWLPGNEDWYVLYFHAKGSTKHHLDLRANHWRDCMTKHCVAFWRRCVDALDNGYDACGCHWFT